MNVLLGDLGVLLAFAAAIAGIGACAMGLVGGRPRQLAMVRVNTFAIMGGMLLAVAAMQRALITRDFSVAYVADVGNTKTPELFNIAAMWSSLEGSILLWGLVLAGYVVVTVHHFRHRLTDPLVGWAMLTLFVIVAFFTGLMMTVADPFVAFDVPAGYDGNGPNPLLQNHILMAFHPPILYLGYVGFSVPFAFAIAALVTGRVGEGWLLETRRWTLYAWAFLTVGILLGAWWAYDVLGWGGYWGWDPVENASLLPWLTGTAYLHSVMVQERRGMLRVWNLSLVCSTFALTILGTFLTRSGVVGSVHAFSDSDIGPVLLAAFGVVVIVTVGLIAWRGDELRAPGRIDSPLSRDGGFLANNLLFAAFAFIVLLGTVFPLIVEAVNDEQISVGRPYFDAMAVPIGLCLLFLMAVAPVLPWRKASGELLADRLWWPAWSAVAALAVALASGAWGLTPLVAFALCGLAAGSALRQLVLATRRQGWRGLVGRTNGGMIVHLGVIVLAIGLAASGSYLRQADVRVAPGEVAVVAGNTLEFNGMKEVVLPQRSETQALVTINGEEGFTPALTRYPFAGNRLVPTPALWSNQRKDVQVSLVEVPENEGDPVVLKVTVQPLVVLLWLGGAMMAIGTVLSAVPGGRRRGTEAVSAPLPTKSRPLVTADVGSVADVVADDAGSGDAGSIDD